jgi:hypothetical protein
MFSTFSLSRSADFDLVTNTTMRITAMSTMMRATSNTVVAALVDALLFVSDASLVPVGSSDSSEGG